MQVIYRKPPDPAAVDAPRRSSRADVSTIASGSTPVDQTPVSSTLGTLSELVIADTSRRAERVQQVAVQYQGGNYMTDSGALTRGLISDAMSCVGL